MFLNFTVFRYADALIDASTSLNHDPTFKKSILRRSTANFELGNHQETAIDCRRILCDEPKNSTALSLMKRIYPPAKMNFGFLDIYAAHALRCKFKKPYEAPYIEWMKLEVGVKFAITRHLVSF
jgi:hypothetical protein